jgi:hypothetical protein
MRKRLKVIVSHSADHLERNLEEFINSGRIIHQIDFRPVPSAGTGLIHAAYILYEEKSEQ